MIEVRCPICESAETEKYWDRVWESHIDRKVYRCGDCELFFLYPFRTEEEQRKFDQEYDRYIKKREELVSPMAGKDFDSLVIESIQERYDDIKEYFKDFESMLEIGAEKGYFLDIFKGKKKEIVGVDACPEYRDLLKEKGYEAYLYVEDVPKGRKFDRICFFSLLEHILDPFSFLKNVEEHLEDGGWVIIEVPNAYEPLLSLYDVPEFKDFYFQDMHHYVYSPRSMEILLKKVGLKVKKIQYKQRYGLDNHITWVKEGRPGGDERLKEKLGEEVDRSYKARLEQIGMTDSMYIVAEKE